jgi:hypothetical protein
MALKYKQITKQTEDLCLDLKKQLLSNLSLFNLEMELLQNKHIKQFVTVLPVLYTVIQYLKL